MAKNEMGQKADYPAEITQPMMARALKVGEADAPLKIPSIPDQPDFLRSEKPQNHRKLTCVSGFEPAGDQIHAIDDLTKGLLDKHRDQVLLGVTGSGKTFTMARIIQETQRPALILAPNKTLAAQLYGEFCEFFPENAVEYFVSYYDYYQPEAYVVRTDTYIDKESSINEQIDRLRHAATRSLLERDDVIVIASVSCIYGIGSPESYSQMSFALERGSHLSREDLLAHLVDLHYTRKDIDFTRGAFRVAGEVIDIFPSHYEDRAWRVELFGDEIEHISEFDPLTGKKNEDLEQVQIYPNSHYVTPRPTLNQAIAQIKRDLTERVKELSNARLLLEAQRLEQRTHFDIEMIESTGSCAGIENYSRYLTGRNQGEPPPSLFEYLPKEAILFIDESHVTVPQLGGMFKGDFQRKRILAQYGFRLPACIDNRPLKFEEWDYFRPQTIYVSATPGHFELERTQGVFVDQVIRPTGLIDPETIIRPALAQVDDLIDECLEITKKNQRVLVTTLTKRMAEDLSEYMHEQGIKVRYLHSDITTLERIEIIQDLRRGVFDVLVGINLLREGLDIPECALVAILDADKEGFLRSQTSLVQTIGRAARHIEGRAILYADKMTASINYAVAETKRRRQKQIAYNHKHDITPQTIQKPIADILSDISGDKSKKEDSSPLLPKNLKRDQISQMVKKLRKDMNHAASELEFEKAALLRDEIRQLEALDLQFLDGGKIISYPAPPKASSSAGQPGTRAIKAKSKSKSRQAKRQ